MKYIIIFIFLIGVGFLTYQWIELRKAAMTSPGYARRKAAFYLFSAFVILTGITSIFAEAIFEALGLRKPNDLEWQLTLAYIVLCLAVGWMFRGTAEQKQETKSKGNTAVQVNHGNGNTQTNNF